MFAAFVAQSPHLPTLDQRSALEQLAAFLADTSSASSIFILKGYAGTGKTTLVSLVSKAIGKFAIRPYLMAPTGRAAKVMAGYSGRAAFTIHRTIYKKPDKGFLFTKLARNYHRQTLFIVDEASMIAAMGADNLLGPLLEYVFENDDNKLLLVGDDAQLPPVSQPESLALNLAWMQHHCRQGVVGAQLKHVVRQAALSGILANATALRNHLRQNTPKVSLHTRGFADVFAMTGERVQEGLEYAYNKYGPENTLMITRSNKRAAQYNQMVRQSVLHLESELDSGDLVMIVKNNYAYAEQAGAAGF
jgi:exodeoxyribonuclease-5